MLSHCQLGAAVVHLNLQSFQVDFKFQEETYLVITERILCSKFQLLNDELGGPHLHAFHGLQDRFEVHIIQSFSRSPNKSGEHVAVRSESCSL